MPGEVIDHAFVDIIPKVDRFASQLKKDIDAAFGRVRSSAKSSGDGFSREWQNATSKSESSFRRFGSTAQSEMRKVASGGERLGTPFQRFAGTLRDLGVVARSIARPLAFTGIGVGLAGAAVAAFQLLSALTPVIGLLATLPGLLVAAGSAAGALVLGFMGIGDAVKALGQQQAAAATSSGASAKRQAAHAEQIRSAQERVRTSVISLENARRSAADANEAAADRIRSAEEHLGEAQREARQAQVDLNDARREARQRLIDMRLEVERSALSEEDAALSVREARERLNEVLRDPKANILDRERATLSVKMAEQSLREVQARNKQLHTEEVAARRAGVEGSDEVVTAKQRIADANRGVTDAAHDVTKAQQEAARASADGARQIAEAARDVRMAQEAAGRASQESGEATSAAVNKVKQAFDNLSPAGQRFARFIFGLKDELKTLQAAAQTGLLPGVEQGIRNLLPLLPGAATGFAAMGRAIGALATNAGRRIALRRADFDLLNRDSVQIMQLLGTATLDLVDALLDVAVIARPLTLWVVRLVAGWAAAAQAFTASAEGQRKLAAFLREARDAAASAGRIIMSLTGILFGLIRAAFPSGKQLLGGLDDALARLSANINSLQGQNNLKKFFDGVQQSITTAVPKIREFLGHLRETNISTDSVIPTLKLFGAAFSFITQHVDTIIKHLPTLINLWVLYKSAQAAANYAALASIPLRVFEIVTNRQLAASNRALLSSNKAVAAAAEATTVATTEETVAKQGGILASIRQTIVNIQAKISTMAQAVASGIATAAQWAWNAAVTAFGIAWRVATGPIGLAILAITAIIAIIVVAYKKNESFRRLVDTVWAAIKTAVKATVDWFVNTAGPFIVRIISDIARWMDWLWKNKVQIAWSGIQAIIHSVMNAISVYWNGILKPTLTFIANMVIWLWRNVAVPAFNGILASIRNAFATIRAVWEGILRPTFAAIGAAITFLWRNVVLPTLNSWRDGWRAMIGALRLAWTTILHPMFNSIRSGLDVLKGAFETAVRGIKIAWDKLMEVTKVPVRFVIDTVMNKGIIAGWNWISDKVLGGKLHVGNIPLPRGFAAGGVLPGYTPGRDVYRMGPYAFSGGEAIMRPEWTRAVGPQMVNMWNSVARTQGVHGIRTAMGFADGGILDRLKNLGTGVWSGIKNITGGVTDFLTNPVDWLKKRFAAPLGRLGEISNTGFGRLIAEVPRTLASKIFDAAKSLVFGVSPAVQGGGGGGVVSNIGAPSSANRSLVHAIFASMFGWGNAGQLSATDQLLMHESGYRNTAQNPTSTAYGMFQFLNSTWAGTGVSKTSDPRMQAIAGGRYIRSAYGSPIGAWSFWSGHHWYAPGGIIPTFDGGGTLVPGLNLVHNGLGRPETVAPVDRAGRSITIGPGAVQLVLNGPVDAATIPQVQHALNETFQEFLRLLRVGT